MATQPVEGGVADPLLTYQVVVNLIAATTTKEGLKVQAALDSEIYPSGIKVSDAVVKGLNLSAGHHKCGYVSSIRPSNRPKGPGEFSPGLSAAMPWV